MDQAVHPVSSRARLSLARARCVRRHLHHLGHDVSRDRGRDPDHAAVHQRRSRASLLAGAVMYAWLRCAQSAAVRRREHPDGGALRRAAVGHRQRFRASGRSRAFRRGIAALIVTAVPVLVLMLRLGVLQQARADAAGVARHCGRSRRRGDDRDAHAHAVGQRAAAVSCSRCSRRRSAGASARCCRSAAAQTGHGAQLHVRADAVRRRVPVADVDRDRRVVAVRSRGGFAASRRSRCCTWSCSAASSG